MNNESMYQKNKTNEPEINISLVLTTQKTANSETTKAFQSQFLSLSWASTRKHNSVSLTSLEVTKASPIAADVQLQHQNKNLNCQWCHCKRKRMKAITTRDQPLCIHQEWEHLLFW